MNRRNLHVWLNRRADGPTRHYCDVYEPAYRQNAAPSRCLTPAEHPPSRICKRGRINGGGGGRYSRQTCGRSWRGRRRKKKIKEENELEISSRAGSVIHLAGPPTSRVPPSYIAPIRQRKAGPHPSEEGRGSQPQFHIEERGRRWRWWETREERKPIRRDTL